MSKLKLLLVIYATLMLSISTLFKISDGSLDSNLISALEKEFLSGLGLTKRPRSLNKNIHIPDDVIEMYFLKTGIKIDDSIFQKRKEKGSKIRPDKYNLKMFFLMHFVMLLVRFNCLLLIECLSFWRQSCRHKETF